MSIDRGNLWSSHLILYLVLSPLLAYASDVTAPLSGFISPPAASKPAAGFINPPAAVSPSATASLHEVGADGVRAGDVIFLTAHMGGLLGVNDVDGRVFAHRKGSQGRPGLFIEKAAETQPQITSGDIIFLRSHKGKYLDASSGDLGAVWARQKEADDAHAFVLAKLGGGPVMVGDTIFLRAAAGGALLEVGSDIKEGASVSARAGPIAASPQPNSAFVVGRRPYGSLHDVVGEHGVLMITLDDGGAESRNQHSLEAMSQAGIFPIAFPATNYHKAPPGKLQLTCPLETDGATTTWCDEMGRRGQPGCKSSIEQAITDSHRRALIAAQNRDKSESEWTAIIEDDVVPVMPERFDREFQKAWAGVPSHIGIVRLGWCTFDDLGPIEDRPRSDHADHDFRLVTERWWTDAQGVQHYYTGGCTTGYLVRRDFIPEMLKIFPCCCPIDCCLERQLFYAPAVNGTDDEYGKWRGPQIMIDMDARGSKNYSAGFASFDQSGVFVQDNRHIKSERPEWNHAS